MVTKKPKGLGRGLDALLGPSLSVGTAEGSAPATPAGTPMMLALHELAPGQYQPRTRMDEGALYELAESIKSQGIMQPILVRRLGSNRPPTPTGQALTAPDLEAHYEIIAGERRFRAARLEDLNPLEEAQGIRRLTVDFGLTHEQAAQAVGKSRSAASNLLRLLQLTEPVQTMLMAGDIDMGHARALLALQGAAQITAANQVSAKKMSVREAESLVRKLNAEFNLTSPRKPAAGADKSGDVRRVEEELSDLLLAQVEVRVKKKTKRGGRLEQAGELAIAFGSLDELNGLIERLRGA